MKDKIKIYSADYVMSSPNYKKLQLPKNHEYAFIGRSNVGKSSLINMICERNNLALVSKKPGKTKMLNLFLINGQWNILDLPGYGYAKVSKKERQGWTKSLTDYLQHRRNLVNVFVLIDANILPQKIDIDFINFLGENYVPFSIVFTKIDKSRTNELEKNIAAFKTNLKMYWEELPPMFRSSANTKEGHDEILSYIISLNESVRFEDE